MSSKKSSNDGRSPGKRRMYRLGVSGILLVAIAAIVAVAWLQQRTATVASGVQTTIAVEVAAAGEAAHYVGSPACAACHTNEAGQWQASQHHGAMAEATSKSVLANFNATTITRAGVTSKFFQRDGKFFAQTSGPDGKLHDYQIKYTYGLFPLQQYLVEFPDGRLQPLQIAWDTRSQQQGGQRWFDLYPGDRITHEDMLFWTRPAQNWNFMCADCHSTNVKKNYDAAADSFKTTWSEINVGCEACHGPGSRHLEWAELKRAGKAVVHFDNAGLSARLDERDVVSWSINLETGNSTRSRSRETDREIQVCAQCHSRRGQIADGYQAGKPFLDFYRPALLVSPLYHADGQQQDEVYKWASFLQSKMYAKGVTCSDCHNPHTGKLRAEGNAVCASCHLPSKYDTEQHSHHQQGSAGAQCAACHMPTSNYMVVDPRHDHSIRVPRPDESVKFGVPNACNQCHAKRTPGWAQAQVRTWYGHDPQGFQHFTAAFAAAAADSPDAQSLLQIVAMDSTQPAIARATALSQLDPASSGASGVIAEALHDPNALIRLGALEALANTSLDGLAQQVVPLLSDPMRTVRISAAEVLAPAVQTQSGLAADPAFKRATDEYVSSQHYNADRAESRVNLGTFHADRGDGDKAEAQMKAAIQLNPLYVPAYVNLADLYRAMGRDAEGVQVLRQGLLVAPGDSDLHYALGLALVRAGQLAAAISELQRTVKLSPDNAHYSYVYAVALNSNGQSAAAITVLEKAIVTHPDDRDMLEALVSFHQARGEQNLAGKYAKRLQTIPGSGQQH